MGNINDPLKKFYGDPGNLSTFSKMAQIFFDQMDLPDEEQTMTEIAELTNTIDKVSTSRYTTFFLTALLVCTMVKLYRKGEKNPDLVSSFFTEQSISLEEIQQLMEEEE